MQGGEVCIVQINVIGKISDYLNSCNTLLVLVCLSQAIHETVPHNNQKPGSLKVSALSSDAPNSYNVSFFPSPNSPHLFWDTCDHLLTYTGRMKPGIIYGKDTRSHYTQLQTLYPSHCTLHTAHCTLRTAHYTLLCGGFLACQTL